MRAEHEKIPSTQVLTANTCGGHEPWELVDNSRHKDYALPLSGRPRSPIGNISYSLSYGGLLDFF